MGEEIELCNIPGEEVVGEIGARVGEARVFVESARDGDGRTPTFIRPKGAKEYEDGPEEEKVEVGRVEDL